MEEMSISPYFIIHNMKQRNNVLKKAERKKMENSKYKG